jgi:hypothetical protein
MEFIGKVPWGVRFYIQPFLPGCLLSCLSDDKKVACAIYLGDDSFDKKILTDLAEEIFLSKIKNIHIIGRQAEELYQGINHVSFIYSQELLLGRDPMPVYGGGTVSRTAEIIVGLGGSDRIIILVPDFGNNCQQIRQAVKREIHDEIEFYKNEWRELGFFYDLDEDNSQWLFTGSLGGLLKFRDLLLAYATNPHNDLLSEHDHYGTYLLSYLKIMTWNQPGICANNIHGSLSDLQGLAYLVESKLKNMLPQTEASIGPEYAKDCGFSLVFRVMPDDFDPASMDPLLKD